MSILSESQEMLGQLVARFLFEDFGFEDRRRAVGKDGWAPQLWNKLANELGILGIPFPESLGGLGLGPVDSMVAVEALGRGLAAEPYLSSIVMLGALVGGVGEELPTPLASLVSAVIKGTERVAFAITDETGNLGTGDRFLERQGDALRLSGRTGPLACGGATYLVLSARTADNGPMLVLLERSTVGVAWNEIPMIDGTAGVNLVCDASIDDASIIATNCDDVLEQVHDALLAALAAEIVGIAAALLEATADFAKQRTQFGKPIAQFQVIKHRLAAMHIECELARSMALLAALKQNALPHERRAVCAAAKARAAQAGRVVAQGAVQIHGGIGTTDELIVGTYFKRLLMIEALFGKSYSHVDRYQIHRSAMGHTVPVF